MESAADLQAVVRQGTFDTDLSQSRATKGDYEIPIIDSEERRKSAKERGFQNSNKVKGPNASVKGVVKPTKEPDTKSQTGKGPSFVHSPSSSDKTDKKEDKKPPVASKQSRPEGKMDSSESKLTASKSGTKEEAAYETLYQERNTLLKAELAYKRRIKQLEEEANGFLQSIEDLNSENKLLRSKVDLLENKLRDNVDSTSIQSAVVEEEKKVLNKQEKKNPEEIEKEGSDESLHVQLRDLKAQVIKLQTDNHTINEENIKLKAEHLDQVKRLHALEKEKASLATSVTDVESEKLDKIKDLHDENVTLKKEARELRARNTDLEKKVDSLEFENKALSESLSQKKNELGEILSVMKEENKFDNEIREQKSQIKKLQDEKRELEMTHVKDKRVLNEELGGYKAKYEESCKDITEIKTKFDTLDTENCTLKSNNIALTASVKEQKGEIERLNTLLAKLQNDAETERKRYETLKAESDNANSDLISKKDTLEKTNEDLQKVVNDKESQISKLIAQMDTIRAEREEEKSNWKKEKNNFNEEIKRLSVFETSSAQLDKELKRTKDSLEDSVSSKRKLAALLTEKENSFSFLEQQVFELNMKLDNMTKRFNQIDREKRDMEVERRGWEVKRDKFNDIEASNKRLTEENRRLRGSLEDRSLIEPRTEYKDPPEAWTGDSGPPSPTQRAVYIGREEKRRQQQNRLINKRGPITKSSPTAKSKSLVQPKRETKPVVNPSRSYEDLRKEAKSPGEDATTSLPDIQRENRLTYGLGYRTIHRNRIKAAHKNIY